jgi:uncharacterized coiled-coil DUF342 family protein
MKNTLQNLLIFFALCLCGLCTYQWYGQVTQRKALTDAEQANYDQTVAIQGYTNTLAKQDLQISQMDSRITELRQTIVTNNVEILTLRNDNTRLSGTLEQYKTATEAMKDQIKQANEAIKRQNDMMKELVTQRDEFVKRLNQAIADRNETVKQYNDLVKKVEEMQAAQAEAAKKSQPKK